MTAFSVKWIYELDKNYSVNIARHLSEPITVPCAFEGPEWNTTAGTLPGRHSCRSCVLRLGRLYAQVLYSRHRDRNA
jgi:hypothetical protein